MLRRVVSSIAQPVKSKQQSTRINMSVAFKNCF